eukprot:COSAG05_NODE_19507_length_291_cov_1.348958_1_plen_76_part_00
MRGLQLTDDLQTTHSLLALILPIIGSWAAVKAPCCLHVGGQPARKVPTTVAAIENYYGARKSYLGLARAYTRKRT